MLCKVTLCAGHVSANIKLHQLRWSDLVMRTAISCTECSQVAGPIQKVGISSSKVSYILHTACTLHLRSKPLLCIPITKLNC